MPSEKREDRIRAVSDLVRSYLEAYELAHREKSILFANGRLAHVARLLGSTLLPDLTENAVHRYIRTRLSEGACGRTINMEIGELSRAVGREWRELWPKVRKLEERKDLGRALTPDEEDRLLHAAGDTSPNRNLMLYTFVRVALATGMRSGEIFTLRWGQVDFEKQIITVGPAKTSSGTGRQIPMNAELQAVLPVHASWYAQKFGELRPEWCVFPGRVGKPQPGNPRPLDPADPQRRSRPLGSHCGEKQGSPVACTT